MTNFDHTPQPYIGIRSGDDLPGVGRRVTKLLGVTAFTIRDGMNIGGGDYVHFLLNDCECYLIDNGNEDVRMDDLAEFEYYLWGEAIRPDESGSWIAQWNRTAPDIESRLRKSGIETKTVT